MILQALKEYYDRKAVEGNIASVGWIQGGIDFIIHIDKAGVYLGISDLRENVGKKKSPKPMNVPNIGKQALKHSNSGKDANLLWDNASFVFGLGDKGDLRLDSIIKTIDHWIGMGVDCEIDAVRAFFEKGRQDRNHFLPILSQPEYGEVLSKGGVKISFKVEGSIHKIVFDSPIVAKVLSKDSPMSDSESAITGTCLITGKENVPIELTHTVTKGVWGAQTSGACLVSFNKESFNSYGKEQSLNAPVGKLAASEYVKSLNTLLGSKQCVHIADASTVFWSEKKSDFESDFSLFFSQPPKDDPDAGTRKINALFESVNSGAYCKDDDKTHFYVLGLAPNAARIAVRFWQVETIRQFAEKIRQHFEDLKIVKSSHDPEYYPLWRLLANVATQGKSENIPPNLSGDFMRSILLGMPYPATLLQAALRRTRAGIKRKTKGGETVERVIPEIAALIKAYLNRYHRVHPNPNHKEVKMGLDTSQPSIGYQLGRLFSALEKIQEEANPGLNATIRERFYGSACASPVTVFANLMRLKNHHLAKMDNKGRVVNFERLLAEIVGRFDDFPAHLDLHEQGRFAIGYYHQRQDFFTKKTESDIENK